MAPNFFAKLVKATGTSTPSQRSGSSSPTSPTQSRHPTISVSRASTTTRPSLTVNKPAHGDSDAESINPNVTIVPPSPRTSDMSMSISDGVSTPGQSSENLPIKHKPSRRLHSLSLGSKPIEPSSPSADDEVVTPTPHSRPPMPERDQTLRPLSHSSSTGNLKESSNGTAQHPRSATISTPSRPEQDTYLAGHSLQRTPSNKSTRSGLRIRLGGGSKTEQSPASTASTSTPQVRHDRPVAAPAGASSSSTSSGLAENGAIHMSPIVESPTGISPASGSADMNPPKPLLSSATLPNIQSSGSGFLSAPDNSDTVSIYSVGGTKKKKLFRRGSFNKEKSAAERSLTSPAPNSAKSPKRKNTGLASALAASGLAMANPTVITQISPTDATSREGRSNSINSAGANGHRARGSIDNTRSPIRSRATSISYATSEFSDRSSFVSGVGSDEDEDDLDLTTGDIPVTGFAVASARRNQEFHDMFPAIPEGDYLIEDYGCALQREILIQGRLYVSENHVCFHANIFGWITDLSIPMYDVISLEKKMTAFVIPNAIQVATRNTKYTFTSFLSRDTTFDVIYNVWRSARPEDSSSQIASARGSLEISDDTNSGTNGDVTVSGDGKPKPKPKGKSKVTQCACGKAKQHYSEVAMDIVLPGTTEKIYNLMFTSGFIKDFMRNEQKLTDIQISDWMPLPDDGHLLSRNMSYIKPLTGSIGPRSTRCELHDEAAHCDFDDYVSMVTTTRTPEVPSGGVFSVKTRTCITWASNISTRILVTTQVEWTGRSFIKGIIEKSAIDGQKTYHIDLEKAMRDYIHKHSSEFIPEGVDVTEVEETSPAPESPNVSTPNQECDPEVRTHERNQRGLQWAYDTFEGAAKVAKHSAEGAIELIKDAWDQSSSSTILYFVIVLLVVSNIWTLMMMGSREEAGRRKELKRTEEREKWIQGVVSGLWEEMSSSRNAPASAAAIGGSVPAVVRSSGFSGDIKEELSELNNVLDSVEERVRSIRGGLQQLASAGAQDHHLD